MNREDLEELHYITLIANILSIRERGILSHNRAKKIPHDDSMAMPEIQERRKNKIVPGGNKLHDSPENISGVYASGTEPLRQIQTIDPTIPVTINGHLFFQ